MKRTHALALAALLTAEAMNLLDSTIVSVAAPAIRADLAASAATIPWFAAAYTVPFALLLITGGRLGDIAGRRRVFRVGVAGFVLASLCCALAPSAGVLIAARAVQGAAAALVIPQTIGLIKAMFTGAALSRALGMIGPVMGLSAVLGPVLGGVLTHADLLGTGWRPVFAVNLPLGLAVLALAPLLPEDRAAHSPRLDLTGTVLAAAGVGLVVYPVIQGEPWWWVLGGLAALVAFGLHQRRARYPLVEQSLFADRGFPAALACCALVFAVTVGLTLVVALQVQLGQHGTALAAALTLVPWSAGLAVAAPVAGAWLLPRLGARAMYLGLGVTLAGVLAAAGAYHAGGGWPVYAAFAVCGIGAGVYTTAFFTTALHRVRPHETGSAAGLLNAVQQLGGTLGTAVLGTMFLRALAPVPTFGLAAALLVACAVPTAVLATARAPQPVPA